MAIRCNITKRIVGYEAIKTKAGGFNCYKIEYLDIMFNQNITYFEYICNKGIIKRKYVHKDINITSESSPEIIAKADYISEYELLSTNF